nr:3'-5' exonuclease KapD [Sutcliffiella rhizosphaerae]
MSPLHFFIDFEFTMSENRSTPKNFFPEIIEAGIVIVEKDKIINQFSTYIRPKAFPTLTNRCKSFLNISQKKVQDGASFKELIHIFNTYNVQERGIVVTWGNMDMKVLKHNCEYQGIAFPTPYKHVDLSLEYKKFFGDQNQTGLWKAVQEYGKEGTGKHHRALDDALTTYNIFRLVEKDKRYLAKPMPTTIGERIDLTKILNKYAL